MALLPYVSGSKEFAQDTLIRLAGKLKEGDGWSWETVFHENPSMDLNSFVNYFSGNSVLLQILFAIEDGKDAEPAGMTWLSDLVRCDSGLKRAIGSFTFFKEYMTPNWTTPLGNIALEYWFENLNFSTIVGLTPSLNRPALAYLSRMGFTERGKLVSYTSYHGNVCDAVIGQMTRNEYFDRKPRAAQEIKGAT